MRGTSFGSSLHTVGKALKLSHACTDPRTQAEAYRRVKEGWLASEKVEIANHHNNHSWVGLDRSELPPGRRLVKLVWAYKVKRSGKLKSRLCVQGGV